MAHYDRHIMMVTTAKYISPETDSVYRKKVFNFQIKTSGSILKGGGQGIQWGTFAQWDLYCLLKLKTGCGGKHTQSQHLGG